MITSLTTWTFFRTFVDILDPYHDNEAGEVIRQPNADLFLPNLRYLGYQTPLNLKNDAFLKLIQVVKARWFIEGARGRLQSIQFNSFMHPYAVSNLDALRKETGRGLKVMFDLPFFYSQDNDS